MTILWPHEWCVQIFESNKCSNIQSKVGSGRIEILTSNAYGTAQDMII